jgi:TolB-like protein
MSTPSITAAQVVAALSALAGALVVLFKLNLTQEQQAALITIIATAVPIGWVIADSIIRHGRSNAVAAQHIEAAAQIAAVPADQGDAGA